ncbi:hydroxyacylglutathione hydrolase [Cobetia marina]|uniref:hydroxyacylglutathione hydrolase n=1 Tax=Cobetia TaxID=204286 RepID=UPI0015967433|nr:MULTISPECIES: hydroxyacylglutathione hydrolase [Cobetia]MDH2291305.1 hydroxyacylglutathione hydrolase [Cobetia sp. 10Alg 146]MDI6002500.1 hydroxyacylglutathione hydrolase [Cobetia pacifica]MDO6788403.1 hydroxyacylglutathione hydrolase [Cobetia marina]
MMSVTPIAAFQDNYIWLIQSDDSDTVAVVDPGDATPVIEVLETRGLTLDTILITHHHQDHTGGLPELIKRYRPRVVGPHNPAIEGIDVRVADGDSVRVQGRLFDVLEVPGHTLDHIAFVSAGMPGLLFCGDTLFSAGCGRLFEGTPEQMHQSLTRLASLPEDTLVFPAHEYTLANLAFSRAAEPDNTQRDQVIAECERARETGRPTLPSRIARERQINPFLRSDDPTLQQRLLQQGRLTASEDQPLTSLAAFTALRQWKDSF